MFLLPNLIRICRIGTRLYGKLNKNLKYKKCYEILGVSEGCDQENIRRAYLLLVKKYHPDSPEGNLRKFQEVDEAFKTLTQKKSRERWGVEEKYEMEAETFDIRHTAPQHRQYLSYGGAGIGTPFQREKQYRKMRAMQASSNVLEHRIAKVTAEEKALMDKKVPFKHNIKTKYGYERLVEDLIQESMSNGEFNNLSGCGKPLKGHQNINPYVDFVTHKLNQVLIDNGFTPEWISLQKEIREEIDTLREGLLHERVHFGPVPLSPVDESDWEGIISKYKAQINTINKKINKFNLVVPVLNKQMLLVDLKRESERVLKTGKCAERRLVKQDPVSIAGSGGPSDGSILKIFSVLLKKIL